MNTHEHSFTRTTLHAPTCAGRKGYATVSKQPQSSDKHHNATAQRKLNGFGARVTGTNSTSQMRRNGLSPKQNNSLAPQRNGYTKASLFPKILPEGSVRKLLSLYKMVQT